MTITSSQVVRVSVVALFLWFGFQQLISPGNWVGFLPGWTGYLPIPGEMLVQLNGWAEVVLAILLAMGVSTRIVAALLGIHLFFIALSAGGAIGVRDAALAVMTLSLVVGVPDAWTFDARRSLVSTK